MNLFSSGIILSGGSSTRFGTDKILVNLEGKPLIQYVLDVVIPLVDETIVVVKSTDQASGVIESCKGSFILAFDESQANTPLAGALAGMNKARNGASLLLPCDAPLLSPDVLHFLLHLNRPYDAVIPKWPNGNIEPLHAAYNTVSAREAAAEAIDAKDLRMFDMIRRLKNVLYVSTELLKQLSPNLSTFENVNTPEDLNRIRVLLRAR